LRVIITYAQNFHLFER